MLLSSSWTASPGGFSGPSWQRAHAKAISSTPRSSGTGLRAAGIGRKLQGTVEPQKSPGFPWPTGSVKVLASEHAAWLAAQMSADPGHEGWRMLTIILHGARSKAKQFANPTLVLHPHQQVELKPRKLVDTRPFLFPNMVGGIAAKPIGQAVTVSAAETAHAAFIGLWTPFTPDALLFVHRLLSEKSS